MHTVYVDKTYTKKSMEMSHRWALRSLKEFEKHDNNTQALYGIVQGGVYEDLRTISSDFINQTIFLAKQLAVL
jgi:queuine tRNA-ribosyltransferase